MAWAALYGAILFEVAGITTLKYAATLRQFGPFALALGFYAVSFTLLTFSIRTIPVSVAYAIWSGVGTLVVVMIGLFWFKEPATALKLLFIAMIVIGAVGLNLVAGRS